MKSIKLLYIACITSCCSLSCFTSFAQDFEELNAKADKEYETTNYQIAVDLATQAISLKINPRSYQIRANSLYWLKEYARALDDFSSAIANYSPYYPTDELKGNLYHWKARCEQMLKKYNEAVSDFSISLSFVYEDEVYTYWNRAACFFNLGKFKESDDDYTKTIARIYDKEDLAKLYLYRGNCNNKLMNYEIAEEFYTRTIEYAPDYFMAYIWRG